MTDVRLDVMYERIQNIIVILGIHLTQVGSIPCGWAASESLRRSPGSAPLGPWGASAVSGGEIDAKRALCSCVALASQWRLLIARPKRPLFSPVSGAHHHMLGLPESDGYPVAIVTTEGNNILD